MPQQSNETSINYGTMDANGAALLAQVKKMILELQGTGLPGVQLILDKYGFHLTDWGTTTFHLKASDGKTFIG